MLQVVSFLLMEMATSLALTENSSAETHLHALKDGKVIGFWPA